MTGMELLEALSFVDEKFVAEAETAKLGRNVPWMKLLSVAACLCILLAGAFALENMGHKRAETEAAAPAAPMAAAPAATEAAPKEEITEEATPEAPLPVEEEKASDELQHIPYAKLRVVKVLEDGSFEAIAEADETMEMDTQVRVIVDPSKVPGAVGGRVDIFSVSEGAEFDIEDGAYDPEANILYIAEILLINE